MDIEKDSNREAFEAWFESRYDAHFMQFALDLDMYVDKHTQTCWEAWQAAKAQAVPEGFVLVNAEQLNQWGHMANYAEQYGCPECFEARGYAHNLACEINSYFEPVEAQEQKG